MFSKRTTAEMVAKGLNLDNQIFLCTGINTGLGKETLRVLVKQKATVFGTCRTLGKAQKSCEGLGNKAIPVECDLSSFSSLSKCIQDLKSKNVKLDGIIANAGLLSSTTEAVEGVEKQFFVNHVAHFYLITQLLDLLSPTGRVVVVSSDLHKYASPVFPPPLTASPLDAYRSSKLANVLFAQKLARKFAGTDRLAFSLHPGVVVTDVARNQSAFLRSMFTLLGPLLFKSVEQGAATQVFAAVHPDAKHLISGYLENCALASPSPFSRNVELQERLWADTKEIIRRLEMIENDYEED